MGCWLVGGKRCQADSSISNKSQPKHSQTTNRSNSHHFSINRNHEGPFPWPGDQENPFFWRFWKRRISNPPPRTTRLLGLESGWGCSRWVRLGLRIPKLVLESKIGHRGAELWPNILKIFTRPMGQKCPNGCVRPHWHDIWPTVGWVSEYQPLGARKVVKLGQKWGFDNV